jgi:hypothetical protein
MRPTFPKEGSQPRKINRDKTEDKGLRDVRGGLCGRNDAVMLGGIGGGLDCA